MGFLRRLLCRHTYEYKEDYTIRWAIGHYIDDDTGGVNHRYAETRGETHQCVKCGKETPTNRKTYSVFDDGDELTYVSD